MRASTLCVFLTWAVSVAIVSGTPNDETSLGVSNSQDDSSSNASSSQDNFWSTTSSSQTGSSLNEHSECQRSDEEEATSASQDLNNDLPAISDLASSLAQYLMYIIGCVSPTNLGIRCNHRMAPSCVKTAFQSLPQVLSNCASGVGKLGAFFLNVPQGFCLFFIVVIVLHLCIRCGFGYEVVWRRDGFGTLFSFGPVGLDVEVAKSLL